MLFGRRLHDSFTCGRKVPGSFSFMKIRAGRQARIEVSKLANGEGHGRSSQFGFGFGLPLGTGSACFNRVSIHLWREQHGVNACNIASRSALWLEASSCNHLTRGHWRHIQSSRPLPFEKLPLLKPPSPNDDGACSDFPEQWCCANFPEASHPNTGCSPKRR